MVQERNGSSSLTRTEILDALTIAKPAVGRGQFVPVLSHFCFTGEEVIACDDVVTIGVALALPIECAVPADLTLKLLASLTADKIAFDGPAGGVVVVRCGKSTLKVPALSKDTFVFKREKPRDAVVSFTVTDKFVTGLSKCLVSVGNDPTHPAQMGITFVGDGDDAFLYSTDNVTMSRYRLRGFELPSTPTIVPTLFCQLFIAMAKAVEVAEIEVHLFESSILARFGDAAWLQSKLVLADSVLDFEAVFTKMTSKKIIDYTPVPPPWDSAFTRAESVSDAAHPVTRVDIDDDGNMVLVSRSAVGESEDTMKLGAGGECGFAIDPSHVLRVSKVASKVAFAKAAMLMASDDGAFTHLISHCSEK